MAMAYPANSNGVENRLQRPQNVHKQLLKKELLHDLKT